MTYRQTSKIADSRGFVNELSAVRGDPRLVSRCEEILEKWRRRPGYGFPEVFDDEAGLMGAYRFFSNISVSFDSLVEPQIGAAIERAGPGVVLSLEDTTAFCFGGEKKREGLGRIVKDDQGFLGHFAFLASSDGLRRPFGLGAAELWTRPNEKKSRRSTKDRRTDEGRESLRWERVARQVDDSLSSGQVAIHIQDREGDIYQSLASMRERGSRFIVRCIQNRCIDENERGDVYLYDALEGLPVMGTMNVKVSARPGSKLPDKRKSHPPRKARTAEVAVTATNIDICAPVGAPKDWLPSINVNVVHVFEPNPPADESPIEWILLTTEPISTFEEVCTVIELYGTRWLIEEFFKSIKTGCDYEKRQLQTYHALKNALAVCLPIAVEMLALRALERTSPELPAADYVSQDRIEVIRAFAKRYPPPQNPTVKDILFAIAGMGGFLKRNGRPGWLTLRRGYTNLLNYEAVWIEAKERCV